jgi:hypothetical protein
VDVADDVEGSGGDEGADEVQIDEGSPTVVTASSISSCTRVERRLERRWSSGERRRARSAARLDQGKISA